MRADTGRLSCGTVRPLLLSLLFLALPARGLELAVTFDDGPKLTATPLLSPAERNERLLAQLAAAKVTAALFVTLGNGADRPEGLALLRAWGEAGHAIGNHTVTHLDLNASSTTLEAYEAELLACDAVIREVPGYRPWFRFTFLREGNTPEKRDGIRAFLAERTWLNARVTVDTSDWRLDQKLAALLRKDPKADLAPLKAVYLAHLRQRANAFRDLSRRLLGRDVGHTLLLHHNLLNALFLADVLAQLRADGWTLVAPEVAFADPVYREEPDRPAPGQSLLLSLARARGWKLVPEFERLMDDGDAEIEALAKQGY